MKVLMMPDYRAVNPYQTLLGEAVPSFGTTVQFPKGYRRVFPIWRAIQQSNVPIEVLHLHWITPYLKGESYWMRLVYSIKFLADIWLVKQAGSKIAWTVHNLISHEAKFPQLEWWAQRQLVKLVDQVIVHHEAARTEVVQRYQVSPGKVNVIPHGYYRTVYGPAIDKSAAREQLGLSTAETIYLNFGMLRPYKGIETLLTVWQQGQAFLNLATLLIAGKPKDELYGQVLTDAVAKVDQATLHDKYIKDADIPIYFSAVDVVILPFENILTSGSLLLAMSYGKPIIAPRVGGIPEALGEADSLLYEPNDELGLLHAIKQSLEIDLVELGKVTNRVCDRLSWDTIGQKTHELYRSIIAN